MLGAPRRGVVFDGKHGKAGMIRRTVLSENARMLNAFICWHAIC
jgi:hypothetical protein